MVMTGYNVTVTVRGESYPANITGINYQAVKNLDTANKKVSVTVNVIEQTDQMLLSQKAIVRID